MEGIQYIGEHLLPGQIGHFAAVVSFVASLLAVVAYSLATQRRDSEEGDSWKQIGRISFVVHGFSVITVIGIIFYMMINQYYEYNYVWSHVSEDLPFKYIASAFWEGQEGSFLLWMFWHVVLGFILLFTAKQWESPVLATISLIQLFISSMVQGIYLGLGDYVFKLGISPFVLLRDTMNVPIFANADYVSLIQGTGLNPLLQNYWMTIHPPTLFLGFASTAVPFAYAVAGLWTKQHKAWLKPVLPWALFSGFILGTGILMGGAWAYEALNFGGYWAWDPVENASLVPWLILLAGIHTALVAKATGHSIRFTYIFFLATFVMIVYSTFLTRSGVLGDTSVHSFTENGLENQLLLFLLFFAGFSILTYFLRSGDVPAPKKEEDFASKEFWMFIGSLVLLFSSIAITLSTSLPVYNKIMDLFEPGYAGVVINDPVEHHNRYQLYFAIFIGALSSISQFLRFREQNFSKHRKKFFIHLGVSLVVSVLVTLCFKTWIAARAWQYVLLLFIGVFTAISNLDYLLIFAQLKTKATASVLSHVGFGLMLIGILASGLNKTYISHNKFAQEGLVNFTEEEYKKNIILLKGATIFMNGYDVTYVKDSIWGHHRQFEVNYKRKNELNEIVEDFNLYPNVLYDKGLTKIAAVNPSTHHYWNKDIFTHVPFLPPSQIDKEMAKQMEDTLNYQTHWLNIGDTLRRERYIMILEDINEGAQHIDYKREANDLSYGAKLVVYPKQINQKFELEPVMALRKTLIYNFAEEVQPLNLKIKLGEEALDKLFVPESDLGYLPFTFKQGQTVRMNGYDISLDSLSTTVNHPDYTPQEKDIAVMAYISVKDQTGKILGKANPVYLVRDSKLLNFKSTVAALGLHFRFIKINPDKGEMEILIGTQPETASKDKGIPVLIAENMPRTDWIVLEAIIFPGINFFWAGTIMMMLGLLIAMFLRLREKLSMA